MTKRPLRLSDSDATSIRAKRAQVAKASKRAHTAKASSRAEDSRTVEASNRAEDAQAPKVSEVFVLVCDLETLARDYLKACRINRLSPTTIERRRIVLDQLVWLMKKRGYARCGRTEIREYTDYLSVGHLEKGGRWNNPMLDKPASDSTIKTNFGHLRAFFAWLVDEDVIPVSPMARLDTPKSVPEPIKPFSPDDLVALAQAAKSGHSPLRDLAIFHILLDCGLRASELCNIRRRDVEFERGSTTITIVHGKGRKTRTVPMSRKTRKALLAYLDSVPPKGEADYLFTADRGTNATAPLTRSGLLQLVERWGSRANLSGVRCSPHTFRHTFAVEFLRGGGMMLALKSLLGHTQVQMVSRYVQLAESDLINQHNEASPVDRLERYQRQTPRNYM